MPFDARRAEPEGDAHEVLEGDFRVEVEERCSFREQVGARVDVQCCQHALTNLADPEHLPNAPCDVTQCHDTTSSVLGQANLSDWEL